jgi:tRNA pseudouridine13 synthase
MTEPALPYLTTDPPGIGGVIRVEPEEFEVVERPLYLPCGAGEHLYVRVTKRGLSTPELVARFAERLGVKHQAVGVAGLKDARAVTTQMVSLHGVQPEEISRLRCDDRILAIEVLGRHRNRLRQGHHRGNEFRIVIREVAAHAADSVPAIIETLVRRGVPNYFGPQRQGRRGENFMIGRELLTDASRRSRMARSKRMWFLHAFQSHLFNRILARRITRLDRLLTGDWAMKHENGACFPVTDAELEQPRAERFEISPTGLLFGSRSPWATGEPGEIERAVALESGGTPESLTEAAAACGFRGERRSLRVRLGTPAWQLDGNRLTVTFALPPGAYATSVLRELMKTE